MTGHEQLVKHGREYAAERNLFQTFASCLPDALVDVPSRQLSGIALVAPFNSARSYLIRKIVPGTPDGGPIPGTFGQLEPPDSPLSDDQIRAISDWIDGGALP